MIEFNLGNPQVKVKPSGEMEFQTLALNMLPREFLKPGTVFNFENNPTPAKIHNPAEADANLKSFTLFLRKLGELSKFPSLPQGVHRLYPQTFESDVSKKFEKGFKTIRFNGNSTLSAVLLLPYGTRTYDRNNITGEDIELMMIYLRKFSTDPKNRGHATFLGILSPSWNNLARNRNETVIDFKMRHTGSPGITYKELFTEKDPTKGWSEYTLHKSLTQSQAS